MPWATTRPAGTQAKYRSKEHRARLVVYKRAIQRDGYVVCAAVKCLRDDRAITNTNGMQPDGVTVGHEDNGIDYRGPEHRVCNLHDASTRARARQSAKTRWVF